MAKKGKTGSLGLWAFVAIVLNAIAWLWNLIETAFKFSVTISGKSLSSILTAIASLALSLIVLLVAHDFAERQSTFWRVLYWILAIATILSILFGIGYNFVR